MSQSSEEHHFYSDVCFTYKDTNDGNKKLVKITKNFKIVKKPEKCEETGIEKKKSKGSQKSKDKLVCASVSTKVMPTPEEVAAMSSTKAMQDLCELFKFCFLPEFVLSRKFGLIDWLKTALRYPTNTDYTLAMKLAPILAIQLGSDASFYRVICSILNIRVRYGTKRSLRGLSCTTLGIMRLLQNPDTPIILETMKMLEEIISEQYIIDGKRGRVSNEPTELYTRSIVAWAQLLTLLPPADPMVWEDDGKKFMPKLNDFITLLDSRHASVRIAAAETLALMLESGRAHREKFWKRNVPMIKKRVKRVYDNTDDLCKPQHQEMQKESFEGVLRYLEGKRNRIVNIKFAKEPLKLESWAKQFQYAALYSVLGDGVKTHLKENYFIRDMFDLNWNNNTKDLSQASIKSRNETLAMNSQ